MATSRPALSREAPEGAAAVRGGRSRRPRRTERTARAPQGADPRRLGGGHAQTLPTYRKRSIDFLNSRRSTMWVR